MFRRVVFALCLCFTVFSAVAQNPTNGDFTPADCPFDIPDGATVDCGYLTVPERHANPDGTKIKLAVAILRASSGTAKPDPVIYLEGGPGSSALSGMGYWVGVPLAVDRDFILLDQRGTGYSEPGLFCDRYEYDFDLELADSSVYFRSCARFLRDEGIDLSAYNSTESAGDVAMLARALGYEQVNLYGISYGTRLAFTVMRDHPQIVRAVVLDSPYPPQAQGFELQAPNGWSAMQALFAACEADLVCNDAVPDLEWRFSGFLQWANLEPVTYDFGDGVYDYYGPDFIAMLFQIMYDHTSIPYIPAALSDLIDGDPSSFAHLYYGKYQGGEPAGETVSEVERPFDIDQSDGVYNSVHCAEEIPFNSEQTLAALAEPIPNPFEYGLVWAADKQFLVCQIWRVDALGAIETQAVFSDIPSLVLVGEFDPITPPVWGRDAVSTLSHGTLVIMPGAGHGIIGSNECGSTLGTTFFNDPTATIDTSCVDEIEVWFAPMYAPE